MATSLTGQSDIAPPALQPGETLEVAEGVAQIVYFRPARADRPLAVFLPGGGHMARIAYGHPGADRHNFLDAWLAQAGFGMLAISYPSDHNAFSAPSTQLTVPQWSASLAAIIDKYVAGGGAREFFLLGWSMAGGAVATLPRALRARELRPLCYISLAATAPVPNLSPNPTAANRLTAEGYWDSSTRHASWLAQLARQRGVGGRPAVEPDAYLAHYVVNMSSALRGQPRGVPDPMVLGAEHRAFDYEDYPLLAAIIPEDRDDPFHALADRNVWGALNTLRLARRLALAGAFAAVPDWPALRALVDELPRRLSRTISGNHFFFVGEPGAAATARFVVELTDEARAVARELQDLVGGADAQPDLTG
jgi:hypothetical protein